MTNDFKVSNIAKKSKQLQPITSPRNIVTSGYQNRHKTMVSPVHNLTTRSYKKRRQFNHYRRQTVNSHNDSNIMSDIINPSGKNSTSIFNHRMSCRPTTTPNFSPTVAMPQINLKNGSLNPIVISNGFQLDQNQQD